MTEPHIPFFDSHAHLDMLVQRGVPVDEVLAQGRNDGLCGVIAISGSSTEGSFEQSLSVSAQFPFVWSAVGIHPHGASGFDDRTAAMLAAALENPKVVALGEVGLDYHYNYSAPHEQRQAFVSQIQLAHRHRLPVIVHTRNADDDTLSILRNEGVKSLGGVIHCFSASEKLAQVALDLGMYISFSGIVTFPKSTEIQSVAANMPEDKILCETDAPFLSPVPLRGRVNTPPNVRYVVEKVAALRNASIETMAKQIVQNTCNCFRVTLENVNGAKNDEQ